LDVSRNKSERVEKLNKINIKIGYPDKWKDYSKLDIKSIAQGGSYFENMKNLSRWNFQKISTSLTNQLIKQNGTCRHKQ
jgi:endothelin-converting enzyme/putative endopeptidase